MREVDNIVFTADSKTLLSGGPESIVRSWDLEQGKETRQLDTGISHVRSFCLTADDKMQQALPAADSRGPWVDTLRSRSADLN